MIQSHPKSRCLKKEKSLSSLSPSSDLSLNPDDSFGISPTSVF